MIGAIIGDIAGSRFEFNNHLSKDFEIFSMWSDATDDSVLTIAVADAILRAENDLSRLETEAVKCLRKWGRKYPDPTGGYGSRFISWLHTENPAPYNSCGNGSAMRVSPVGFAFDKLEDVKRASAAVTGVTHDHPDGLKGAEATAVLIWMARHGADKDRMRKTFTENYYPIDFTCDSLRGVYKMRGEGELCRGTVPQAVECFFEATDFEDAIRNAVSIGGDSDTIGAITGGIAEAFYGVPAEMKAEAMKYLDPAQKTVVRQFCDRFMCGS